MFKLALHHPFEKQVLAVLASPFLEVHKLNNKTMSVNISKLKRSKVFENDKIKISFSTGDVSDSLSVYIKDENGKNHHILWEISPDRCHQNFDKANEKIREFVKDKIDEWVNEEEDAEKLRLEAIKNREHREENELRKLMDAF